MNAKFEDLVGFTITAIDAAVGDYKVLIELSDGRKMLMFHHQDCCESVRVEDICGDLADLIGTPILQAEVPSSDDRPEPEVNAESCTWTFYRIATVKGAVTIRWLGESNGYYGEGVDCEWIDAA